jgi:outer membrane protein assembly factor BamB
VKTFFSLIFTLFFASTHAKEISNNSGNWNQWRGPMRDGFVTDGAPWPTTLSEKKLSLSWRQKIGKGYSGPITSDSLVFTIETKGKNEVVRAFERSSGQQKWETQWPGSMSVPFFAWKNGSWIRSTPVFDGENLYVCGMRDYLVCLDAESGEKNGVWTLWKDTVPRSPPLGLSALPWSSGITSMYRPLPDWLKSISEPENPFGASSP